MQRTLKTRSGKTVILPTTEEDAAITAAAMTDPDAQPLTDEEWEQAKPTIRRGRPKLEHPKIPTSIRLDADLVDAFKATGPGWQTRVNAVLREWLKAHPRYSN